MRNQAATRSTPPRASLARARAVQPVASPGWMLIPALLLVALLAPAVEAKNGAGQKVVQPKYSRQLPSGAKTAAPAPKPIPSELQGDARAQPTELGKQHGTSTSARSKGAYAKPYGADPERGAAVDRTVIRRALRAGTESARERAARAGFEQYYRVGFWAGLREAVDHPRLGRQDYREGRRLGLRDREARELGRSVGVELAEVDAQRQAERRVEAAFRDLSREPRPDTWAETPAFTGPLPRVTQPTLEEVLAELTAPLGGPARQYGLRPVELYECVRWAQVYSGRWAEADRAFDQYLRRGQGRDFYRTLTRDERLLFERFFAEAFRQAVRREQALLVDRAYEPGFDDGWELGYVALVELSFRRGYSESFAETLEATAEESWFSAWPSTYQASYGRLYGEWARSPRPEIVSVSLEDGDRDGVFEPGESVSVAYQLANYGGASAFLAPTLRGPMLGEGDRVRITLPRRSIARHTRPLEGRLLASAPLRTETTLTFAVAGLEERLSLRVGRPLELSRKVRLLSTDALAGEAEVEVVVSNRSRRPVAGHFALQGPAGIYRPMQQRREGLVVAANSDTRLRFPVHGLPTLALLSGHLETRIVARRGSVVQDTVSYRFPELAVDLSRQDLELYLLSLARRPAVPRDEMAKAQTLVLRRLEADWRRSVAERGNPYREDLRRRTPGTALGTLVATYQNHRGEMRRPEVFTSLTQPLRELAADLPGAHPWLRRSFRKLSQGLST